jgi:hypothetical protein
MDPLTTFVLAVAQQVLAGVLTNVFSGARIARRKQVESNAETIVKRHAPDLSRQDLDVVVHRVLAEIRYLTNEHPDLEWHRAGVVVLPEVPQSAQARPEVVRETVKERLARLERIVAIRRSEIELPKAESSPEEPEVIRPNPDIESPDLVAASQIQMRRVPIGRDPGYWKKRLEDLERSIRTKRQEFEGPENDG